MTEYLNEIFNIRLGMVFVERNSNGGLIFDFFFYGQNNPRRTQEVAGTGASGADG